MEKTGRKPLEIDEEVVRKLSALYCSMAEIASVVNCSVDTLERRFAEVVKKGRAQGRVSLKRKQFDMAITHGSIPMLIWLGKQYLGQTDTPMTDDNEETYTAPESLS